MAALDQVVNADAEENFDGDADEVSWQTMPKKVVSIDLYSCFCLAILTLAFLFFAAARSPHNLQTTY